MTNKHSDENHQPTNEFISVPKGRYGKVKRKRAIGSEFDRDCKFLYQNMGRGEKIFWLLFLGLLVFLGFTVGMDGDMVSTPRFRNLF